MLAERLGSYSIRSTLAGISILSRRNRSAGSGACGRRHDGESTYARGCFATATLGKLAHQGLVRSILGALGAHQAGHVPPPRAGRFVFFSLPSLTSNSPLSSLRRIRFHRSPASIEPRLSSTSGRCPNQRPTRLTLPLTRAVRTLATLILSFWNTNSTALAISILFASG